MYCQRMYYSLGMLIFALVGMSTQCPVWGQGYPTMSLTIVGSEQPVGSGWDQGTISISVNGDTQSYTYGQLSTPASIASAFGAEFSLPSGATAFCPQGICAQQVGNTILFTLTSGSCFQQPLVVSNSASFSVQVPSLPACGSGSSALTLACTPAFFASGQTVSCTAGLPSNVTGMVTFNIDGQTWTVVPAGSSGSVTATQDLALTPGIHQVVASYNQASGPVVSSAVTLNVSASIALGSIYSYSIVDANGKPAYAANSNILAYTDSVNGSWTLGYDSLNRLTSSQTTSTAFSQTPYSCWSYDSFGNRIMQASSSQPLAAACNPVSGSQSIVDAQSFTGAASNQITSRALIINGTSRDVTPAYDSVGNVIQDPQAVADPNPIYVYDAENRICAQHGVSGWTGYLYNADGARVAKGTLTSGSCDLSANGFVATSMYILGPDGSTMTEVDGQGNWVDTNVPLPGQVLATYDQAGLHFALNDWLGTRRVQTDYAGNPESTCQSMPFGDGPIFQQTASKRQFTGKERDQESGLDYFGARYYGSSMGRFSSPDEPFIGSDPTDPQSWNLYSYVRNNPLIRVDPDGHDCIYADGAGGGTLQRGDCTNAGGKDDNGVFVNGHVDENSFKYNANNNSSSFSYTPDGAGAGTIGVGTLQGPNLNGGFEAGSLAAGVFGAQSASTWNNAAGTVNAVAGFEMDIMAPWAGAAVNCMGGGSKVGCAANMALAVLPAGGEMRAGRQLLQASRELTAAEYISKNLKGGINAVFPGQFKGMAIKEIEAAAKNGDRAARTAMKLLTDGRFTK